MNDEADSKAGRVGTVTFDPENIPEIRGSLGLQLVEEVFRHGPRTRYVQDDFRLSWACLRAAGRKGPPRGDESGGQDKCSPPQAELHIIPRGDHLFSRGIRQKAVDIALEFLSRL